MADTYLENNFYTRRMRDYALSSADEREKSKKHWLECYAEELAKGRFDEHSARIIADMALIDSGIARAAFVKVA